MASVKYGLIITEIKGKVQGSVLQGGYASKVLRNKGYNAARGFELKTQQNSILASIAGQWRGLTDEQRATWDAATSDWPSYDKFGQAYTPSGYQMFMAYILGCRAASTPDVLVPGSPPDPIATPPFALAFVFNNVMTISYTGNVTGNWVVQIFMTAPLSAGRAVRNVPYTLIARSDWEEDLILDVIGDYEAKFGPARVGMRIGVRIVWRNTDFPYPYYTQEASSVVVPV